MFYRAGGTAKAINRQYDEVYADTIGMATDWLPISKGDTISVAIARASIVFGTSQQSAVTLTAVAPEVQVLMERVIAGGQPAWPMDQWQNMVVHTTRRAPGPGWVRLRIININNSDGTGVQMQLGISRTGETGAVT
jgi:hypothetical protein